MLNFCATLVTSAKNSGSLPILSAAVPDSVAPWKPPDDIVPAIAGLPKKDPSSEPSPSRIPPPPIDILPAALLILFNPLPSIEPTAKFATPNILSSGATSCS